MYLDGALVRIYFFLWSQQLDKVPIKLGTHFDYMAKLFDKIHRSIGDLKIHLKSQKDVSKSL